MTGWPGEDPDEARTEIKPPPPRSARAAELREQVTNYDPVSLVALAILEVSAALDRLALVMRERP